MDSPSGKPSERTQYGNRSSDRISTLPAVQKEEDMLILLEAYRLKEISADSVSGSVELSVLFGWLVNGTVTQAEFDELVDSQSVQEIVLGKDSSSDPLSEEPPESALISELREKLACFPEKTCVEAFTSELVAEWTGNAADGLGNVGAVFLFEKKESDDEGPAISFALEMRAQSTNREGSDAIRAEIVFSRYDKLESASYFQASVPLPIVKNGRRKLFMTFTEAGTSVPLRIPPHVAMAFREKYLVRIEALHHKPKAK